MAFIGKIVNQRSMEQHYKKEQLTVPVILSIPAYFSAWFGPVNFL